MKPLLPFSINMHCWLLMGTLDAMILMFCRDVACETCQSMAAIPGPEMSRMQLLTWRKRLLWPSSPLLVPATLSGVWSDKSLKIGTS